MEFKEYWKDKMIGFNPSLEHALKVVAIDAYRAGLLHAAEQDEEHGIHAGLKEYKFALNKSAIEHRKAAEKLK